VPLISNSSYKAPTLLGNPHINTLYGALVPFPAAVAWSRERIATSDGDFLDLDWLRCGSPSLLILCHGIVGSSRSPYCNSLAHRAANVGWDVLAWNGRGCSGEPNRTTRLYHGGATEDLATVIEHIDGKSRYRSIALVGFSLGANLILKFLGEKKDATRALVSAAVAVSAPCSLLAAAKIMERPSNALYTWEILRIIRRRLTRKHQQYPNLVDISNLQSIKTIRQYDEEYTAPLHGFRNALEYYNNCSAEHLLDGITTPTLILNSADDPFLEAKCHPIEAARTSAHVWLELTSSGGHVSFGQWSRLQTRWQDTRILQFVEQARAA